MTYKTGFLSLFQYWDDEIAMIAQKWASNCIVNHDGYKKRRVPGTYILLNPFAAGG